MGVSAVWPGCPCLSLSSYEPLKASSQAIPCGKGVCRVRGTVRVALSSDSREGPRWIQVCICGLDVACISWCRACLQAYFASHMATSWSSSRPQEKMLGRTDTVELLELVTCSWPCQITHQAMLCTTRAPAPAAWQQMHLPHASLQSFVSGQSVNQADLDFQPNATMATLPGP